MGKRRNQTLIGSDSSDCDSASNFETELLSLTHKRKKQANMSKELCGSDSDREPKEIGDHKRKKKLTKKVDRSSDSSDEDSSDKICIDSKNTKAPTIKNNPDDSQNKVKSDSEQEEGEVLDSNDENVMDFDTNAPKRGSLSATSSPTPSFSEASSESEFDDGFDDNLMGDEEDRKRLSGLSEKERETEIFKRIEQRDIMRTRWEIERKLKIARRGTKKIKSKTKYDHAKHKEKPKSTTEKKDVPVKNYDGMLYKTDANNAVESSTSTSISEVEINLEKQSYNTADYFDHKERSKERKKNVEMNRTDDKRSNAMALLKAKRQGKAKREKEEAKRLAEREQEKDELESVSGGRSAVKLKASEIYSDDSGSSDWDDEKQPSRRSRSTSVSVSSSESEEEKSTIQKVIYISTLEELNKLRLSRFKMERFVNLPIFEHIVKNCFVRISIGNNGQKPIYRVAEIVGVVETGKIYTLGKTRTNRGLRLKHGTQERVFRLEFISNQEFTPNEFDKWRTICEQQKISMPTLDVLERKQLDIKEAFNYEYKEEDVEKIVEEKNRFRCRPTNYAMRKTCLMKERDAAMLRGDYDVARELSTQIEELESRASELDKKRSSSISLISYINDRNRKRNVEDAEKAIMEEARANRGQKVSDPFTRRITQPRMGFKPLEKKKEITIQSDSMPSTQSKKKNCDDIATSSVVTNTSEDLNLYSLHDFDIDLDVSLPVNSVNVTPKPIIRMNETATKRSLNLEDYKKKRGLI